MRVEHSRPAYDSDAAAERNALRAEFNAAPRDSFFPETVVSVVAGMSTAKLALDRMARTGIPFYKIGASVRYKAGDVRDWLDQRRVEVKSK